MRRAVAVAATAMGPDRMRRGVALAATAIALLTGATAARAGDAPPAGAHAAEASAARPRVERRGMATATVASIQRSVARRRSAAGYTYASWLDPATRKVVVKTDAPRSVTATLARRFPGAIDLRPGGPRDELSPDPPIPAAPRMIGGSGLSPRADLAPFWGGGSIAGDGGICSAGFTVQDPAGARFMVTAGHCFPRGGAVRTTAGNGLVGSVVRRGSLPPFDMELIGGQSYGGSIFAGSGNDWSRKRVTGAADPVVGAGGYCRSGQTTGERCGQTIASVSAQVCTQTGCKSPVIVYSGGPAGAGAPGDSGAPLYLPDADGAGVRIAGMHIATAGTVSFAEKWSRIASHFGVTIGVSRRRARAASTR